MKTIKITDDAYSILLKLSAIQRRFVYEIAGIAIMEYLKSDENQAAIKRHLLIDVQDVIQTDLKKRAKNEGLL